MLKLNIDVLYLIFQEFQDDRKTLHSCLLVNKTWCEIIVPFYGRILTNAKESKILKFVKL